MNNESLVFTALGGAGEIGMNLSLYGYGHGSDKKWIIVDCGIGFEDNDAFGIDAVMPNPAFLTEIRSNVAAVFLTHGHEDHIGAIPYLLPWLNGPIYTTKFAANLLTRKLVERDLEKECVIDVIKPGDQVRAGPFEVEYVPITHSIPDANLLAIRTPLGTVIHTGDWKRDSNPVVGYLTDENRLSELGKKGVVAAVCDSTNVFVPGSSVSEGVVADALSKAFADAPGKVIVTAFASNVGRMKSIIQGAANNGRRVGLLGRSLQNYYSTAKATGLLDGVPEILTKNEANSIPDHNMLWVCAGSQGQPRAALARISRGESRQVALEPGDRVIFSSKTIPGNEKVVAALKNRLAQYEVEIIEDAGLNLHASGHPCRDDLFWLYDQIRPSIVIPVHGERRHLNEHAKLALSAGVKSTIVPENGDVLRISPEPICCVDKVATGRLALDGDILIDADDHSVRERKKIAYNGVVSVWLKTDSVGVIEESDVTILGLPEKAESAINEAIGRLPGLKLKDTMDPIEVIQNVRRAVRSVWAKKPVVLVKIR